jgi:hypothetical protein
MWRKIIQLGGLVALALLVVGCEQKEIVIHDGGGGSMPHDAQCLALRHDIGTMNRQHHRGWTKHRIEVHKRMLWKEYHKLGCP